MRERLLLLAAALAAFGASLGSGFHFDDYAIFSDPALTSPMGWLDLWTLRQTRPLTYLTFWLNYQIGGQGPLGYHLLNLALHLGAVLLAYECLRRLMDARVAWVATAIFAVHPLQAEAVNYVWGRSIVLAVLLCLASLLAWLKGNRWEAVAWFAAALLAKEEVAAFPLMLLLLDKGRKAPLAAMFGLALAAGARVIYATTVTPGAPAGLQAGITPINYLLAQGPIILRYLRLLVVPHGFTIDPDIRVPALWIGALAWIAVMALVFLAWRYRSVWFLAGLVLLIPSSSIFPAADLSADRRMYFPLLAFAAAGALLLERVKFPPGPGPLAPGPRSVLAIGAGLVVVFTALSIGRTIVWMHDESLWREAVERAPKKVRPMIQFSRSLPAGKALELLNHARDLAPHDPAIAAEIGKTLLAEGQPEAALTEFGRALALDPRNALNLNNRGVALAQLGQTEAARADFERALSIDPNFAEAKENLQKLSGR